MMQNKINKKNKVNVEELAQKLSKLEENRLAIVSLIVDKMYDRAYKKN